MSWLDSIRDAISCVFDPRQMEPRISGYRDDELGVQRHVVLNKCGHEIISAPVSGDVTMGDIVVGPKIKTAGNGDERATARIAQKFADK